MAFYRVVYTEGGKTARQGDKPLRLETRAIFQIYRAETARFGQSAVPFGMTSRPAGRAWHEQTWRRTRARVPRVWFLRLRSIRICIIHLWVPTKMLSKSKTFGRLLEREWTCQVDKKDFKHIFPWNIRSDLLLLRTRGASPRTLHVQMYVCSLWMVQYTRKFLVSNS